jgi:hypothetical protein
MPLAGPAFRVLMQAVAGRTGTQPGVGSGPATGLISSREGPRVRGLAGGAKRIRTLSPTRVRRSRQPQGSLLTPRWRENGFERTTIESRGTARASVAHGKCQFAAMTTAAKRQRAPAKVPTRPPQTRLRRLKQTPREGRHAVSDFRRRFGGQHQIGVNFGCPRQPVGPEPETTADQERERDVRRARVDLVGEAGSRKEVIRWMCIRS